MDTISTTIRFKGIPVKIENGKVYIYQFGTTITNSSMHYSWREVPFEKLNKELQDHLKQNNLTNK